ncbi:hypothetical protein J6TS1_29760 [Siminovitchia terrae]|uniref:Uncharacterized protein n=1 Tax=Siminovitchia terrae TaxID=1914933 RepID=A0ABQ4KZQ5_SIMTE|nr:hypothetical protein J22TS1_35570 [Siminovitchia terrae]GIN97106.1 hypothetical protein J6TS1_29760 [Siminovitchia terrae]
MTSAGGFDFIQPGFEPPLNGIPIGIHLTTYRSGRLLLNKVKQIINPSLSTAYTSGASLERIKERLSHSYDEITKKVYLHTTEAVRKRDAEKFGTHEKFIGF